MTTLNTTFIIHAPLETEFLDWVKNVYMRAAEEAGIFGSMSAARILTTTEPQTMSFAVQLTASRLAEAEKWHDTTASLLKDDLQARWGERVLFFTTYMEKLAL